MTAIVKRDNIKNEITIVDDIDLDNCIIEIEDPIVDGINSDNCIIEIEDPITEDIITEDPTDDELSEEDDNIEKPIEKVVPKLKEFSADEIKSQIANRIYNFK
jgi:hypothetical protein